MEINFKYDEKDRLVGLEYPDQFDPNQATEVYKTYIAKETEEKLESKKILGKTIVSLAIVAGTLILGKKLSEEEKKQIESIIDPSLNVEGSD